MTPAVSDEMVERALMARVPGGSQVWVWLPQEDAYTPHQTARDVMRCALEAVLPAISAALPQVGLDAAQIEHMVSRFLQWKLPKNFSPDAGISFQPLFNQDTAHPMRHEPSGTNLFDAEQAVAMVRHMIDGLPAAALPHSVNKDDDTPSQNVNRSVDARATTAAQPSAVAVGWAYQDKRWDKDHWHLCIDKPRASEGREVREVYLLTTLAPSAAPDFDRMAADAIAQHRAGLTTPLEDGPPSAEAAKPVADELRELVQRARRLTETQGPTSLWRSTINELIHALNDALSQPQGELREAGEALATQLAAVIDRLDGQAYSSTLSALNAFRAALAGRAAG